MIHLRRFYTGNDIFGGSGSKSSHEALLKTLGINDALLQGVEKAVFSSFQIKGILKLNGLLKEEDRNKAVESFNRVLEGSYKINLQFRTSTLMNESCLNLMIK